MTCTSGSLFIGWSWLLVGRSVMESFASGSWPEVQIIRKKQDKQDTRLWSSGKPCVTEETNTTVKYFVIFLSSCLIKATYFFYQTQSQFLHNSKRTLLSCHKPFSSADCISLASIIVARFKELPVPGKHGINFAC